MSLSLLHVYRDAVFVQSYTWQQGTPYRVRPRLEVPDLSILSFEYVEMERNYEKIRRVWNLEFHPHAKTHFVKVGSQYQSLGCVGFRLFLHFKPGKTAPRARELSAIEWAVLEDDEGINSIGSECRLPAPIPDELRVSTPYRVFCHGALCTKQHFSTFVALYKALPPEYPIFLECIVLRMLVEENLEGLSFLYDQRIRVEFQTQTVRDYVQYISSPRIRMWFHSRFIGEGGALDCVADTHVARALPKSHSTPIPPTPS